MLYANVNILAVLVAAIVSMLIGMLWYGPLFGKMWMKLAQINNRKVSAAKKSGMWRTYIAGFLSALLISFVLANILDYLRIYTLIDGMLMGFMIWLGFVATITLGTVLWEDKPLKLYMLNNAYNILSLVIMGAILASWQ